MKILVIHDEPRNADALAKVLYRCGYDSFPAYNQKEALEHLANICFDLALIYLQMQKASPLELADLIKDVQPVCRIFAFRFRGSGREHQSRPGRLRVSGSTVSGGQAAKQGSSGVGARHKGRNEVSTEITLAELASTDPSVADSVSAVTTTADAAADQTDPDNYFVTTTNSIRAPRDHNESKTESVSECRISAVDCGHPVSALDIQFRRR